MPGRLNESSRMLTSTIETGASSIVASNRRRSSPTGWRPLDRPLSSSSFQDPLGLVSLFSRYSSGEVNETEMPSEVIEPETVEHGLSIEAPIETEAAAGSYTSLSSSLNLLRRRELRLREMRARVDGMAERLALMREARSVIRRSSPVRFFSSPSSLVSLSSSPVVLSSSATWPAGLVRRALRGELLASDAFLDANGDIWMDDRVPSESNDPSDTQHVTSNQDLFNDSEYPPPFVLSSYRIVDGVLFNLDGEQVGTTANLGSELRSCKELYDEMAMHSLFLRDCDNDGSLYLYSTIAHNESRQKRRKYSVDFCAGR
ncbi:hypothetical protein PNEG_02169 [Pneumocystis murina B123]|uniref:Uncharacterized protein n=1 Tax=Pneumocystis murina (strain B123) TaxID=1069680 RepID=M7PGJ7_PNEMU|nr:hypothetical protein PNEG_02169 [Pneumocystis murina B123]EMR09584.1 hypothetical protein PNEG_02169 [Pneumocystis murina B123]